VGDIPLWLLVGLFGGWEVFAHFIARNRGEHTLSNRIWALETKLGIPARAGVAASVALLFTHLVFQIP
jgi:hypothetical protein